MKKTVNQTHPDKQPLATLINDVRTHFANSDTVIFSARNETRLIEHNGTRYVIKSFKVPHFFQKVAYSFFKASKAQRSYTHSRQLEGIAPSPVGFREEYKGLLLHNSFYVCEHFDFDFEIKDVLENKQFDNRERILFEFGVFTRSLHEQRIQHLDYSSKNILIKHDADTLTFKLVDVNRMKFKAFDRTTRTQSLSRLHLDKQDMQCIVDGYVASGAIDDRFFEDALSHSQQFDARRQKINRLKQRLKRVIRRR